MTLTEFLLARIAEDERAAEAARGWQTGSRHEGQPLDWSIHMDRWSPGRVLTECEAKRRIVERCTPLADLQVRRQTRTLAHDALAALARPYADHPDYRAEWRP